MALDARDAEVLLGRQRGVLSRSQALACGITESGLRHRLRRGGSWQRVLPGIYLTETGTPTWEQLQTAALLHAGADALITGLAALRNYRLRVPESRRVDVLVPVRREVKSADFVVVHRTRRMPDTAAVDLKLRFAPPERAVADAVRQLTSLADARAVVASAVQQRQCTIEQLAAELREGPIRQSARLRSVLAEVIAGIRSPAEADFRDLIVQSTLPRPSFNATLLLDGVFLAQPDAWWPEHGVAVEIDSRDWHLLPEHWEQTMARHRRMAAAGINVLHASPRDVRERPTELVVQIEAALRAGRALAGITTRPQTA
jgi:hypothetical protein